MKVGDIVDKIADIESAQKFLERVANGEINDPAYVKPVVDKVNGYLFYYIKALKSKEIKED